VKVNPTGQEHPQLWFGMECFPADENKKRGFYNEVIIYRADTSWPFEDDLASECPLCLRVDVEGQLKEMKGKKSYS
jgi:hypothetical protein